MASKQLISNSHGFGFLSLLRVLWSLFAVLFLLFFSSFFYPKLSNLPTSIWGMFQDPSIKLFGSDIQIHIPINSTDLHSQIHSLPQQPIIIMVMLFHFFLFFSNFSLNLILKFAFLYWNMKTLNFIFHIEWI
jgi:hypothetical protein